MFLLLSCHFHTVAIHERTKFPYKFTTKQEIHIHNVFFFQRKWVKGKKRKLGCFVKILKRVEDQPIASNCTSSWSLNSLDSLLIRVLMNTNTWLCSTQIGALGASAAHRPPICCVAVVGKTEQTEGMKNIMFFLNIQIMQAHNFWMRRGGSAFPLFWRSGKTFSFVAEYSRL